MKYLYLIALTACVASSLSAQRWETPEGNAPWNPFSFQAIDPFFVYDATSGLLSVDTSGPNGINESMVQWSDGDDFPFMVLEMSFAGQSSVAPVLPTFADGVFWPDPTIEDGVLSLRGGDLGINAFLPVSEELTPILQLDPGLSVSDFQNDEGVVYIDTVANKFHFPVPFHSTGDAYATGAFQIVPEPRTEMIAVVFFTMLLGLVRRT